MVEIYVHIHVYTKVTAEQRLCIITLAPKALNTTLTTRGLLFY